MRIGIIADIHANIYGLRSVLEGLKDADLILCAGDIVGYYPFVNEVFGALEKHNVVSVLGNHDDLLLRRDVVHTVWDGSVLEYTRRSITKENLNKLSKLPKQFKLCVDSLKITMVHGSPWDKLNEYIYPDCSYFERFKRIQADVIILGHTHWPMIKHVGEKLIINPGSCGQPRDYDPRASYAVLNTGTRLATLKRVPYNVEKVCKAVKELGFDSVLADILRRTK